MEYELVIRGGRIIDPEQDWVADIGIAGGKIAAIGEGLKGKKTYAAEGMLVVPGGIDPHVHLGMPTPNGYTSDSWATGTKAAIFGGTTTVIDFIEPEGNESLMEAFRKRRAEAEGEAMTDYALHMTITNSNPDTLKQIEGVAKAGVTSFKHYTTYEGFVMQDEGLILSFEAVRKAGGVVLVHCENDAIIQYSIRQLTEAGKLHPSNFPDSRPPIAEVEAIRRVIAIARFVGVPLYIVHISTGTGARAVDRARKHGQVVYGETCPQYLLLNEKVYRTENGLEAVKCICQPPIRLEKDNDCLWNLLSTDDLQTVGTDHCTFNVIGQKDKGKDNFLKSPGGVPGIQLRLSLLYSYGVRKGWLTLQQWVGIFSSNAASIFGLAPRKGWLTPGADADVVVFDPEKKVKVTQSVLQERVDYTPYEGLELTGFPRATFLNGQLVVEDGVLIEAQPKGQFLERYGHKTPIARLTDEF